MRTIFFSPHLKVVPKTLVLFLLLNSLLLVIFLNAFEQNHIGKERPVKQQLKKEQPTRHHHHQKGQPIKFYPPKNGIA
jgi:regulatory protein YycI of two-component signal transduction system YycFG